MVSVTGLRGYQGGFLQAVRNHPGAERVDLAVGGDAAVFTPATTTPSGQQWWAELVVQRAEDLAVRVTAPDVARADLVEIAERVEPSDDTARAPSVEDSGDLDLRVVGTVDGDVIASVFPSADQSSYLAPEPGARTMHRAGWISGPVVRPDSGTEPPVSRGGSVDARAGPVVPTEMVVVTTYPRDTASLDALAGLAALPPWIERTFSTVAEEVNGRPAVLVESLELDYDYVQRTLFTQGLWGDLLAVSTSGMTWAALDAGALVTVAESVREAEEGEWPS